MPTPGDYDIILNADVQFKEADLVKNLSSAVSDIFSSGLNKVFEDMGKVLVKSFADTLERDNELTDKIGKAILQGVSRQYVPGADRGFGESTYQYPASRGGPGGYGGYRVGEGGGYGGPPPPFAFGSTADIMSQIAGQNIDATTVGQIATGKLSSQFGGGIFGTALRSNMLNRYIGRRMTDRELSKLEQQPRYYQEGMDKSVDVSTLPDVEKGKADYWEKGIGDKLPDMPAEESVGGVAGQKAGIDVATMKEAGMAGGEEAVPGLGAALGEEAAGSAAGLAAGAAAEIAVPAAVGIGVAKGGYNLLKQQLTNQWRLQGAMVGGPGASSGAAASAGWLQTIGMGQTADVMEQLGKSSLSLKEMNAAVNQATTAVYGYGMTTGTTTAYLKYQYEILGNSTQKASQQLNNMAGAATASGMSTEQFTQMAMGAAQTTQAAGYGQASMGAGTLASASIRQNVPGMTDASQILGKMPQTPLAWEAASERLGVPLSTMGPAMMGGKQGEGGSVAWMVGEAQYAKRMFGAQPGGRLMAVTYLQNRFGMDMEQAGAFYDKYGSMTPQGAITKAETDQRREAAMAKKESAEAVNAQKGWGIAKTILTGLKGVPVVGGFFEEGGTWAGERGQAAAENVYQKYSQQMAGQHAAYGQTAPLVGAGATSALSNQLTTQQLPGGGLQATQGALTVTINPSKEFDATVYDSYNKQDNIYNQSKGGQQ